jgi:predicted nucleotidyltransferase
MVFGSVARREERPDSDVDMLVEFSRPTGLFGLIRLRLFLEEQLGCRVDIGTPNSLRPKVRETALAEAVRVA